MTPGHLLRICGAETRKLFSRLTARLGLVLMAVSAVATVLFIRWIDTSGLSVTNSSSGVTSTLGDTYDYLGSDGALMALVPRNVLFVGRFVIVALVALSGAGEFKRRTLREDVLRPVPRGAVVLAKWFAVCVWAAVSLGITGVFASALAVPLFGLHGAWGNLAVAYASTFVGDCALAAILLLVAFAVRSVVATLVVGFLFWMINTAPMWLMWAGQKIAGMLGAVDAVHSIRAWRVWLPGAALDTWLEYLLDGTWAWQSFVMLGALLVGGLTSAILVFRRIDMP